MNPRGGKLLIMLIYAKLLLFFSPYLATINRLTESLAIKRISIKSVHIIDTCSSLDTESASALSPVAMETRL